MDFVAMRENMVCHQIKAFGVKDRNVLGVMAKIPRQVYLPEGLYGQAYADCDMVLSERVWGLRPCWQAFIIQELGLTKADTILDIGSPNLLSAVYLSQMVAKVGVVLADNVFAKNNISSVMREYQNIAIYSYSSLTKNGDVGRVKYIWLHEVQEVWPESLEQCMSGEVRVVMPMRRQGAGIVDIVLYSRQNRSTQFVSRKLFTLSVRGGR